MTLPSTLLNLNKACLCEGGKRLLVCSPQFFSSQVSRWLECGDWPKAQWGWGGAGESGRWLPRLAEVNHREVALS